MVIALMEKMANVRDFMGSSAGENSRGMGECLRVQALFTREVPEE
jgi:hypothetical protein